MKRTWIPLIAMLMPLAAAAQHATTYAGQQDRAIKSLSAQEEKDLLAGQGMGLAKAAELNGYPGPAHVLEHGTALGLSAEQRRATEALMQRHKARAREMGLGLVEAERRLDRAFAARIIDAQSLAELTADIGRRQAELRQEHLRTHLEQTALLDERQVRRYNELRGYTGAAGAGHGGSHGHGHGGHQR